jgi:hypothetical protein
MCLIVIIKRKSCCKLQNDFDVTKFLLEKSSAKFGKGDRRENLSISHGGESGFFCFPAAG